MKRFNNLYQKICSIENLQAADAIARKGKAKQYGIIAHDRNGVRRKRLTLQFELDGKDHIVFTTGTVLIETIEQVPTFPFTTTIIEKDEIFYFT